MSVTNVFSENTESQSNCCFEPVRLQRTWDLRGSVFPVGLQLPKLFQWHSGSYLRICGLTVLQGLVTITQSKILKPLQPLARAVCKPMWSYLVGSCSAELSSKPARRPGGCYLSLCRSWEFHLHSNLFLFLYFLFYSFCCLYH